MYAQKEKPKENKSRAVTNSATQKKSSEWNEVGIVDNRPETINQKQLQDVLNNTFSQLTKKGGNTIAPAETLSSNNLHQSQQPLGVVQREWIDTENDSLSPTNNNGIESLTDLIETLNHIPSQAKTIVPNHGSTHYRIDMQGAVRRRGPILFANIQMQIGGDSIAGVICPFDLSIETIRGGLRQALDDSAVLEWEGEEEDELPESDHLNSLLETAETYLFKLDDFQAAFDDAVDEISPDMVSLFSESYSEEKVVEELHKVKLIDVLNMYSAGYISEDDRWNKENWTNSFRVFSRDVIREDLMDALPMQGEL